jgi:hypothetical protein
MQGSGVMYPPIDKVTSQGFDLQFGTNVLGAKSKSTSHTHALRHAHSRSLLSHQAAPPRSHGDRKKVTAWNGARRQCELPRPLLWGARGHPMGYTHPGG